MLSNRARVRIAGLSATNSLRTGATTPGITGAPLRHRPHTSRSLLARLPRSSPPLRSPPVPLLRSTALLHVPVHIPALSRAQKALQHSKILTVISQEAAQVRGASVSCGAGLG